MRATKNGIHSEALRLWALKAASSVRLIKIRVIPDGRDRHGWR
jgi:hypothetical protein